MSSIAVRQAVLADLGALVPLFDAYRQFYGQASDPARAKTFLRERFEHTQSVVFIAEERDNAVGFTQLYPSFSSVSMARTFVLNDLFVAPHQRRKGVGEMLLQAAAEFARNVGAVRLTLSTAVTNAAAQALYESAGWRRDDKFYVYNLATNAAG
jgi:ribosomal protein S18 acetylase RimI-like enzyme